MLGVAPAMKVNTTAAGTPSFAALRRPSSAVRKAQR